MFEAVAEDLPTTGIHHDRTASLLSIIHENDNPYVTLMPGVGLQLLQVDLLNGFYVVRVRFAPGVTLPIHQHVGPVLALTEKGAWRYLEHEGINRPGTYLHEPAGSIHTLHVLADNKEDTVAWFAVYGANLYLNEKLQVESVQDALYILELYFELCEAAGYPKPYIIGYSG